MHRRAFLKKGGAGVQMIAVDEVLACRDRKGRVLRGAAGSALALLVVAGATGMAIGVSTRVVPVASAQAAAPRATLTGEVLSGAARLTATGSRCIARLRTVLALRSRLARR
jgi:hypothetical protein